MGEIVVLAGSVVLGRRLAWRRTDFRCPKRSGPTGRREPSGVCAYPRADGPTIFRCRVVDRHTVKPWFAGKLAFAPKVVDLSTQGFPLVGARIDVIGLEPVASLVYSKVKHQI